MELRRRGRFREANDVEDRIAYKWLRFKRHFEERGGK